jgi:hypothetical protein
VTQGKQKFELWKQYFRDLLQETAQPYAQGDTLDEAEKRVAKILVSKYGDKFDIRFPKDVVGNIGKAYQVIAFAQ